MDSYQNKSIHNLYFNFCLTLNKISGLAIYTLFFLNPEERYPIYFDSEFV